MALWTEREYRVRLAWLDLQWDRPDRGDHYLMQIAAEVARTLTKKSTVDVNRYKLSFKAKAGQKATGPGEQASRAKSVWKARLSNLPRQ